ncbi:MAG: glycosyltransferase [Proteobacteria bacterium]|nr:glycosyltransferase [Pseudomonadota bacterium]
MYRILFAGAWQHEMYEEACSKTLERLGCQVIPFRWAHYFTGLLGKLQHKYSICGPAILKLNSELLHKAIDMKPDIIFIWSGTQILAKTLREIKKKTGAVTVSYVHDDPFSYKIMPNCPRHSAAFWRLYDSCITSYDVQFYSKQLNVDEAYKMGAKEAHVWMQYYVPEMHHPYQLSEADLSRFSCDVVFAGHYEDDGRERYLRALVKTGISVKLYGDRYWSKEVLGDLADYFGVIHRPSGDDYMKALCGAKLCLCFMSKMNRDSYTTRCFEIPACGRLLLSERTNDLQRLFKNNEEAIFFSSPEELVEKAAWLRDHPDERKRIARAGMRRVLTDGHSVDDRIKQFLIIMKASREWKSSRSSSPERWLAASGATPSTPSRPSCLPDPGRSW